MASLDLVRQLIRDIPDFPQPGILFKDITPVLGEPRAFQAVLGALEERLRGRGFDRIVAIESRGFIFGAALADRLEIGFSPVRKLGKLPYKTHRIEYALEYGKGVLEAHVDAVQPLTRRTLARGSLLSSRSCSRTSPTRSAPCCAARALRPRPSSRSPLASGRTPRSSAPSTPSCCDRCRSGTRAGWS